MSFGAFVLFVKRRESFHLNYKLGKKKRWKWETCSPHHCTFQVFPIAFILLLLSIKRKKTIKLVCLYWRHLSFSILPIRQVFRCPVNQRLETVGGFFSLPLLPFWLTIHDRLRRQKKVMYLQLLIFFSVAFQKGKLGGKPFSFILDLSKAQSKKILSQLI